MAEQSPRNETKWIEILTLISTVIIGCNQYWIQKPIADLEARSRQQELVFNEDKRVDVQIKTDDQMLVVDDGRGWYLQPVTITVTNIGRAPVALTEVQFRLYEAELSDVVEDIGSNYIRSISSHDGWRELGITNPSFNKIELKSDEFYEKTYSFTYSCRPSNQLLKVVFYLGVDGKLSRNYEHFINFGPCGELPTEPFEAPAPAPAAPAPPAPPAVELLRVPRFEISSPSRSVLVGPGKW